MSPTTSIIPPGFASHAQQMLRRVQHGISPIELVYTTHERWPLRPGHTTHTRPTLRVSVLDSSFNPPTLAHLALANSLPPPSSKGSLATPASAESYDTRMLLLSVRNADKVLKPGDASFIQRLEMMYLLSLDIRATTGSGVESSETSNNVAIAIIDEPTFVGKSTVLLRFLRARLAKVVELSHHWQDNVTCTFPSSRLTFLLGFDTLIRLFCPKYYPSEQAMASMLRVCLTPDQEACRIVCAHRRRADSGESFYENQDEILRLADEFIRTDRIAFIDIGAEEQTYSSSEIRAKVVTRGRKWEQLVTNVIANYIVERDLYSSYSGRE